MLLVLKNLISRADEANRPANYTWDAITRYMNNINEPSFDYDTFKSAYDNDEKIKDLTNNFNERGLKLVSKASPKSEEPTIGGEGEKETDFVNTSAKRSAKKHLS